MTLSDMINLSTSMSASNNQWSAAQAQKQMDFQREMSSTAHQREVADLKAAGLNPILSAHGSGASSPSGAMGGTDSSNVEALVTLLTKFGEGIVEASARGAATGSGSGRAGTGSGGVTRSDAEERQAFIDAIIEKNNARDAQVKSKAERELAHQIALMEQRSKDYNSKRSGSSSGSSKYPEKDNSSQVGYFEDDPVFLWMLAQASDMPGRVGNGAKKLFTSITGQNKVDPNKSLQDYQDEHGRRVVRENRKSKR